MVQTERVIFREEKNPYLHGIPHYLAVFPDDRTKPGCIACVPFHFQHDMVFFEPYCECTYDYYLSTKIIHKKDARAEKLLKAVTDYYSREVPAKFRMVEKMTH